MSRKTNFSIDSLVAKDKIAPEPSCSPLPPPKAHSNSTSLRQEKIAEGKTTAFSAPQKKQSSQTDSSEPEKSGLQQSNNSALNQSCYGQFGPNPFAMTPAFYLSQTAAAANALMTKAIVESQQNLSGQHAYPWHPSLAEAYRQSSLVFSSRFLPSKLPYVFTIPSKCHFQPCWDLNSYCCRRPSGSFW